MRQYKQLPPDLELAPTLARRVNQLRELRNLTVKDLSKMTRFTLERVEDIEAGLESWLSATDRQRLAAALAIEPVLLQEVETRPKQGEKGEVENEAIIDAILNGARQLQCPQCGGQLQCSLQDALDLDGNPTRFAKAYCTKCPFILK
ncbi:MAG TPA: helix-turn-helix transcriptional regulator [Candidatus Obscuribacterales bacterium]